METLQLHEVTSGSEPSEKQKSIVFSSRFSVVKELAEGGTSVLYLVRDLLAGSSLVVLKCVHNNLLRSKSTKEIAVKEVAIARKLAHPHLIKIYDVGKDKGAEYIVMEYLRGDSLKNLLCRSKFDYSQSLSVIRPIVDVLKYLHSQGVVHSDVKPSNIIITYNDEVKLIDLANCRQDSSNDKPAIAISDDHFFGYSPDYSSPQVINDQPATSSDDVFSVACILYELLEGRSPVSKEGVSAESAKKPGLVNYWQWRVLKRALATDHQKRFQSIDYFYRCFVKAKLIPFLSTCFCIGLLALSLIGYSIWHSTASHHEKHAIYLDAYQQQQSVDEAVSAIRRQVPLKRYQYLSSLNQYPDILRHGALASLYADAVIPTVKQIEGKLLEQDGVPQFDMFSQTVENLLVFYPQAQDLHDLKKNIAKEQNMLANSLTIQLSDIVDGGQYTLLEAGELNSIIGKFSVLNLQVDDAIDENYTSIYTAQLEKAIRDEDWKSIAELSDFAESVFSVLPKYKQSWNRIDGDVVKHAKSLAAYVAQGKYDIQHFPKAAGMYFLDEKLAGLQQSISRSWLNKDIKKHADSLVYLRKQYHLPKEYSPFQKTMNLLNNKIEEKIRYHKSRKQTKSAKSLTDLAKVLT